MLEYIWQNKEWIFSGVGVVIIFTLLPSIVLLFKHRKNKKYADTDKPVSKSFPSNDSIEKIPIEKELSQKVKKMIEDGGYQLSPTPEEIEEKVESVTPFQQSSIRESFKDIKICWKLEFSSLSISDNKKVTLYFHSKTGSILGLSVICENVDLEKYPTFKNSKRGSEVWVLGKIKEIETLHLRLVNNIFIFD
ncbi:hypothetical protein KKA15_00660 [Patescibacteria group bacterium]|nr:hypothetical protein [Patescibacteria group bacterium]